MCYSYYHKTNCDKTLYLDLVAKTVATICQCFPYIEKTMVFFHSLIWAALVSVRPHSAGTCTPPLGITSIAYLRVLSTCQGTGNYYGESYCIESKSYQIELNQILKCTLCPHSLWETLHWFTVDSTLWPHSTFQWFLYTRL